MTLRLNSTPNIVYILADDMGYGDLSCLNPESRIRTRWLDKLAQEGMVFTDAHASSAVCTPSRYSILTGRYNWRSILKEFVLLGYDEPIIEEGRLTVASLLKQAGYHSACIGKWHLGWEWGKNGPEKEDIDFGKPIRRGPVEAGFDYFFGISASLDMPPYVYVENDRVTAIPDRFIEAAPVGKGFYREGVIAPNFRHAEVLPELTDRAEAYVRDRADRDQPFFLYFPLPAPHTPILPLKDFQGKSGVGAYGDFCLQVDHVCGRLMDVLEEKGIAENTIFIFTSDNGCSPMAGVKELVAAGHHPSYVFRGYKADIYEGGHRIPLVLRWPGHIPAGSACDETVCLTDLFATLADFLGLDTPPDAAEDSVSNVPLWLGKAVDSPLREATVHTSIDGSLSIRKGDWKLVMCPGSGGWSHPLPGEECENLPPVQLYHLGGDIGERSNLAETKPEKVAELRELLTVYVRRGRSTPGPAQPNTGGDVWKQLWWMVQALHERSTLCRQKKMQ